VTEIFSRTSSGLLAKHHFYTEPLLWVEGPEDISFYSRVVQGKYCRVMSANGKEECKKLLKQLCDKNSPYVIVMDGDYDAVLLKRSPHRRAVFLKRYAIENYLFHKDPIKNICRDLSNSENATQLVEDTIVAIETHIVRSLYCLVSLDFAHYINGTGNSYFPDHPGSLMSGTKKIEFNRIRIAEKCKEARAVLDSNKMREARRTFRRYVKSHRLVDMVKGHFLFGLIRIYILDIVKKAKGRNCIIDSDALRALIVNDVWNIDRTEEEYQEHTWLKGKLSRALNEASRLKAVA